MHSGAKRARDRPELPRGANEGHAGCSVEEITAAIGTKLSDLFDSKRANGRGGGDATPSNNRATAQPPSLSLEQYAAAKKLPLD